MADDRAWADAPIFRQPWAQQRRHRFGPVCQTPGCGRWPNGDHRHCCSLCKRTRGRKHKARCQCQEDGRAHVHPDSPVDLRSRSRSPTLPDYRSPTPPQSPRLEAVPSARSTDAILYVPMARSVSSHRQFDAILSPSVASPTLGIIVGTSARQQVMDTDAILHGYGAESAPTSTSIEPDQPPTPTSRAADVPSVELLHGDGAESAPTPSASSDERTVCAICHERMRWSGGQTVVLNCGHVYCMHCWQSFLENMRMAVRCPQCKTSVGVVIPIYG